MQINLVLPEYLPDTPIGGYKIIFEYANALATRGHQVVISFIGQEIMSTFGWKTPYLLTRFLFRKFLKFRNRPIEWFEFHKDIKFKIEQTDVLSSFVKADVIMATSAKTAKIVNKLSPKHGRKFYFIQGDERFYGTKNSAEETWFYSMKKIAVSSSLRQILHDVTGESIAYVPNFIDTAEFGLDQSINSREQIVSMLVHSQKIKGTKYGLEALKIVSKRIPNLKVILFGVETLKVNLPDNFIYYKAATHEQLRSIYNNSAIYLMPSYKEGWGLTATEAMQCGAMLITAENGGVDDFAVANHTAIIVKPKSVNALAEKLIYYLNNPEERLKIAIEGNRTIQSFTREKSVVRLEKIFLDKGLDKDE